MKIGVTVAMGRDPDRFAARVKRFEAAGVSHFWCGEAYTADAVSTMGFLAAVTARAQIGSSILPLYTRTPTLLAMTAVGLDKASKGRFNLGIGASGPQVVEGFHGVEFDAPLARTREVIEICRAVWRRERLEHHGPCFDIPLAPERGTGLGKALKLADHPVRDRIPIYVASLGRRNVELTAELADGWLPLHFWPDRAGDVWRAALRAGRAKRAADLGSMEIVAGGPLAIGDDVEPLRDLARPGLALYFGGMGARGKNFYNEVLRRYGYQKEADEIMDLYLGGSKREAEALVPRDLVAGLSLIGDKGYVRDRVAAYREAGVTVLNVQPVGPDAMGDIEMLAGWLT
jgi:F420-dependent oxidoreductase-like protein